VTVGAFAYRSMAPPGKYSYACSRRVLPKRGARLHDAMGIDVPACTLALLDGDGCRADGTAFWGTSRPKLESTGRRGYRRIALGNAGADSARAARGMVPPAGPFEDAYSGERWMSASKVGQATSRFRGPATEIECSSSYLPVAVRDRAGFDCAADCTHAICHQ
jgi:hypothetical protein